MVLIQDSGFIDREVIRVGDESRRLHQLDMASLLFVLLVAPSQLYISL